MKRFIFLFLASIVFFSCSTSTVQTETTKNNVVKETVQEVDPFLLPNKNNNSKELLLSIKEYESRGFMIDFIEEHLTVIAVKGDSVFIETGTPTFQIKEESLGVIGGTRKTILDSPRNVGYPNGKLRKTIVGKPFYNKELGHMTTPITIEWK